MGDYWTSPTDSEADHWTRMWRRRVNLAAAAAVVGVFAWDPGHYYVRFLGHGTIAFVAVLAGLPAGAWLAYGWRTEGGEGRAIWAVAGIIVLLSSSGPPSWMPSSFTTRTAGRSAG